MPKNLNQQDARTAAGTSFEAQPVTTSVEQIEVSFPSTSQHPSSFKSSTSSGSIEAGNAKSEILTTLNGQNDRRRKQILKTFQQIEIDLKIEFVSMALRDHFQSITELSFKLSDLNCLNKDLSVVVYDYLYFGNEPDKTIQEIIRKIWSPFARVTHSWLETCCQMLLEEGIFDEFFYELLGGRSWSLQEIVDKNPDILMNEQSDELLLKGFIENLDYDYLHNKIMNTKNEKQQTVMFTTGSHGPWVTLYREEGEGDPRFLNLFDLLNVRDVNGETAIHINPFITQLLKFRYTTIHHRKLMQLIEMENGRGQTAINTGRGHELLYLREHLLENRYLIYGKPTVLIISTLTGRQPGAQPEAESIHEAFKSLGRFNTTLQQDKTANEIRTIIEDEANRDEYEYPGVSPSAFIVVLMSHGMMGAIQDCNGAFMSLKDIELSMCSVRLSGKPKILIAQCCQEYDEGADRPIDADFNLRTRKNGSNNDAAKIPYQPRSPDFCAIMSSVPGKFARRNKFIPEMAKKLCNLPKDKGTPIHKIFADATQKMEADNIKQTPQILSLLTSEFAV